MQFFPFCPPRRGLRVQRGLTIDNIAARDEEENKRFTLHSRCCCLLMKISKSALGCCRLRAQSKLNSFLPQTN